MTRELPVCLGCGPADFLTYRSVPVWPVHDALALRALESAAVVLGLRVAHVLDPVHGAPVAGDAPGRDVETVACIGEFGGALGPLYAHLTGRAAVTFATVDDALEHSQPSVVVCAWESLSAGALDRLREPRDLDHVPGIIAAPTQAELYWQVLLRAAAAISSGPSDPRRVDVLPTDTFRAHELRCGRAVGGQSSPDEIRTSLGSGAGVLTLETHSDGIDSFVGPLTLCPMDRSPLDHDPDRLPHCQITGCCFRVDAPVPECWSGGRLIAPESVRARVFLYMSCWGVVLPEALEDPAWSVGRRLLASPTIGAMVASPELILLNPDLNAALAGYVEDGVPVGRALADVLRTSVARRQRLAVNLFGDPRVRLAEGTEVLVPVTPVAVIGDIRFLDHYLDDRTTGDAPLRERTRKRARAALDTYRCGVMAGDDVDRPEGAGPVMRAAVLDHLLRRGPVPYHTWSQVVVSTNSAESVPCGHCGARQIVVEHSLNIPDASARQLRLCPACGVTVDAPAGQELTLRYDGGLWHLRGERSVGAWSGVLAAYPKGSTNAIESVAWPIDSDGRPAREQRAPSIPDVGIREVALHLLRGASWSVLRVPARVPGTRLRALP